MTHKSALCVGGPLAGKRYAILHGNGFMVPELQNTQEQDPNHEDYKPNKTGPVEFHEYHAEPFHTPQGDVEFWVPKGQTPLDTIKMLLASYERVEAMRGDLMAARRYVAGYAADKKNHPQAIENAVHLYDKIGATLSNDL